MHVTCVMRDKKTKDGENALDDEKVKKTLLSIREKILKGQYIDKEKKKASGEFDLFNVRNRELDRLRKVDSALQGLLDGSYGKCRTCSKEIGPYLLVLRPWADRCAVHNEEEELHTLIAEMGKGGDQAQLS